MSPAVGTFLVLGGAWLLGSIPWSWLLVRWRTGKDLAAEGSGNVGALNSLRVSRSRGLGVLALVLDLLKGLAAVLGARMAGAPEPTVLAAGVACVAGHALNPWLTLARGRPSGGKGFASAAGAMLPCAPWLVAGWLAVLVLAYVLFRRVRGLRDEAPASLLATLGMPVVAALAYDAPTFWASSALAAMMAVRLVPEVRGLLAAPRGAPPA